jgi:hypothetical protein
MLIYHMTEANETNPADERLEGWFVTLTGERERFARAYWAYLTGRGAMPQPADFGVSGAAAQRRQQGALCARCFACMGRGETHDKGKLEQRARSFPAAWRLCGDFDGGLWRCFGLSL